MERAVKEENIAALKGDLAKATSLVLADFRGINVKNDTALRREFRAQRLRVPGRQEHAARAWRSRGRPWKGSRSCFVGPTAIAYSFEDPAAPAKIATKVAKGEEKFVIKGGYVDGKALDVKGVEALSKLPTKDELRSTFLALLVAAPQNFLALLQAAPQQMLGVLAAREQQLGEGPGGK